MVIKTLYLKVPIKNQLLQHYYSISKIFVYYTIRLLFYNIVYYIFADLIKEINTILINHQNIK